ncbi:MAG: hypothetical protein WKF30_01170 [Pyrinomonadaceae bacterium]
MPIEITSVNTGRFQKLKGAHERVRRSARFFKLGGTVLRTAAVLAVIMVLGAGALFLYAYRSYSEVVDKQIAAGYLRSRAGIYAAPRVLRAGSAMSPERLVEALRRAGYVESNDSDVFNGGFVAKDNQVEIHPRRGLARRR